MFTPAVWLFTSALRHVLCRLSEDRIELLQGELVVRVAVQVHKHFLQCDNKGHIDGLPRYIHLQHLGPEGFLSLDFFFFFFFRSPAISLGFTTFGWDVCVCDRFLIQTIKVVTFRIRGWCVLGVFLLPVFTRLGHERQDLLGPCDEMHVCTD